MAEEEGVLWDSKLVHALASQTPEAELLPHTAFKGHPPRAVSMLKWEQCGGWQGVRGCHPGQAGKALAHAIHPLSTAVLHPGRSRV